MSFWEKSKHMKRGGGNVTVLIMSTACLATHSERTPLWPTGGWGGDLKAYLQKMSKQNKHFVSEELITNLFPMSFFHIKTIWLLNTFFLINCIHYKHIFFVLLFSKLSIFNIKSNLYILLFFHWLRTHQTWNPFFSLHVKIVLYCVPFLTLKVCVFL